MFPKLRAWIRNSLAQVDAWEKQCIGQAAALIAHGVERVLDFAPGRRQVLKTAVDSLGQGEDEDKENNEPVLKRRSAAASITLQATVFILILVVAAIGAEHFFFSGAGIAGSEDAEHMRQSMKQNNRWRSMGLCEQRMLALATLPSKARPKTDPCPTPEP